MTALADVPSPARAGGPAELRGKAFAALGRDPAAVPLALRVAGVRLTWFLLAATLHLARRGTA